MYHLMRNVQVHIEISETLLRSLLKGETGVFFSDLRRL